MSLRISHDVHTGVANTWTANQTLNDDVQLKLGTGGAESNIKSDGTDSIWTATSGDITITAASEINLTKAGETIVRVTNTANSVATSIITGTAAGAVGTTTAHNFQIWQQGDNRLVISSSGATWQFQQATTLSNSSGDISLEPADDLIVVNGKSLKIGGTADQGTTEGTNKISIFDGTSPAGTLANGTSLFSDGGELKVLDASGNSTTLSPHDSETNEWIFHSKETTTGRVLHVDMERLVKKLASKFPDDFSEFIEEYTEEI
jgi:hypothetical protein